MRRARPHIYQRQPSTKPDKLSDLGMGAQPPSPGARACGTLAEGVVHHPPVIAAIRAREGTGGPVGVDGQRRVCPAVISTGVVRTDGVKVRVWVHKSPIAGLGLFAAQDITQGTRILSYVGEKISKAESTRRLAHGNVYIFTFNARYDIDGAIL